jgi:hypothetical protein
VFQEFRDASYANFAESLVARAIAVLEDAEVSQRGVGCLPPNNRLQRTVRCAARR